MSRIRKHFIILTTLITVSFYLLIFVLFILIPIYYTNYQSTQLEKRYQHIIDRLNRKPMEEIIEQVKKYDHDNEDVFLDLMNEDGTIIYPQYSKQDLKKSTQYFLGYL